MSETCRLQQVSAAKNTGPLSPGGEGKSAGELACRFISDKGLAKSPPLDRLRAVHRTDVFEKHKTTPIPMNRRTLILLAVASLVTGAFGVGCKSTPPIGSMQLFNRQDLSDWNAFLSEEGVPMEDVWSVENGILICKGEPMGYLYTQSSYTSFALVVEWRWAPGTEPGNSGVLLRINGDPQPLPRSLEAQLQHGNAGDIYGFHGMKVNGDPSRLRVVENHSLGGRLIGVSKVQGNEKRPGEWNRYEIVLDGSNLTLTVNGKAVNSAYGCEVIPGPIGLQSEGGEIHFRKVQITPL